MIDPEKEELLTLTQAASLIPSSHNGKKTSPSTVFRWATRGLKGIRLETLPIGGKRTSRSALSRFFQALSVQAGLVDSTPASEQPSDRQAEIDRATTRVKVLVR